MFDVWTTEPRVFGIGDIHGKWQVIRDFYLTNKIKYKLNVKMAMSKIILVKM